MNNILKFILLHIKLEQFSKTRILFRSFDVVGWTRSKMLPYKIDSNIGEE